MSDPYRSNYYESTYPPQDQYGGAPYPGNSYSQVRPLAFPSFIILRSSLTSYLCFHIAITPASTPAVPVSLLAPTRLVECLGSTYPLCLLPQRRPQHPLSIYSYPQAPSPQVALALRRCQPLSPFQPPQRLEPRQGNWSHSGGSRGGRTTRT